MKYFNKKMFEDDDDFEIDDEFLDGVFDAEKTATKVDDSLEISRISNENSPDCEFESSPAKRRRLSSSSSPPISPQQKNGSALRTSEESARLVATAVQRFQGQRQSRNVTHPDATYGEGSRPGSAFEKSRDSDLDNSQENHANRSVSNPNCCFNFAQNSVSGRLHGNNASPDVSFTLNTSRVRQRKFPGPAGLLPDRGQRSNFSSLTSVSGSDLDEPEEPLCSQSTASVLEDGPWLTLLSDLRNEGQTLLRRYTVEWVKRKAAAKQLVGQKVPFLAAVLHSIDCSSPDPCVVLRDATGEIPGTLHRSVWDSFGGQLVAGSALVLRLVGVLSTGISARRHYLNITSNNIVTIYSSPLCESSLPTTPSRTIRKTHVQDWTLNQLMQTVNNWEDQSKRRKQNDVMSPSLSTTRNNFPQSFSSSNLPSTSGQPFPFKPPMCEGNRGSNVPSCLSKPSASEEANFVRLSSNNVNRNTACLSNSSTATSLNRSVMSNRPQIHVLNNSSSQRVPNPSLPHRISQNFDPLRQQNTNPENASKAPIAGQNRFVPKKANFPMAGSTRSESIQMSTQSSSHSLSGQENAPSSADLHSSRDLFSDADDIDISSVLDGIDSDSLFGDF